MGNPLGFVDIGAGNNGDLRTFLRESNRYGLADAGGAAGYQCNSIL